MNPIQVAASLSGSLPGAQQPGLALSGQWGTIAAVAAHGANTVDVYLDNSAGGAQASITPGLSYDSGYTPTVGDAVFILVGQAGLRTSRVVLGTMAGGSSGGGSSGVPIGTILMFPVTITYANWLLCNGGTFSAATYPALNTLLGGNTLPNLVNFLPMGAGSTVALGATAGATTSPGLVAHTHTGPSHTHAGDAHTHSHAHTGPAHTHTSAPHTHPPAAGSNFLNGGLPAGPIPVSATTGSYKWQDPTTTGSTTPGATGSSGTANTGTDATGSSVGTTGAGGTAATGSTGSGASFSVLNPVTGVAYYIRAS